MCSRGRSSRLSPLPSRRAVSSIRTNTASTPACQLGATGTRRSATPGASMPATRTGTASAGSTSTQSKASGRCCAPGCARTGASHKTSCRLPRLFPVHAQRAPTRQSLARRAHHRLGRVTNPALPRNPIRASADWRWPEWARRVQFQVSWASSCRLAFGLAHRASSGPRPSRAPRPRSDREPGCGPVLPPRPAPRLPWPGRKIPGARGSSRTQASRPARHA
jgi:hypothetical protein